LTIDAPYMARLVGIIPALAIYAALPLNKLAAELAGLLARFDSRAVRTPRLSLAVTSFGLALLLAYLGILNFSDYYGRYTASYPFTEVTGQAYFVRQMNMEITGEMRPAPIYYDLGLPLIS